MFNVRLAGGHLYGKQLFTWLSLVVSLMASFVLSFFPLDVLDEIWDFIVSVSEGFLTYSLIKKLVFGVRPVVELEIIYVRPDFKLVPGIWALDLSCPCKQDSKFSLTISDIGKKKDSVMYVRM